MRHAAAPAILALLLGAACAEPPPTKGSFAPAEARDLVRVRVEPHLGVDPALHLEAPGAKVVAIVLPAVAGRIVHYALDGENVLWNNPDEAGRPRPAGGYGLDLGPEPRLEPHPVIWQRPHLWAKLGTDVVTVTSGRDPVLGMRVEKQLRLDAATGALDVVQRMKNVSGKPQSYCIWDRTLCRAGGFTVIPLSRKSRFKAGWAIGKRVGKSGRHWAYDGDAPAHPNMKVLDGMLVVRSQGPEQKVGADPDEGWIAYALGSLLFVKYFPVDPKGRYTDAGMRVAHYFNERLAEMEPLSPEQALAPDGEYAFPERWMLIRLERPVTTHEEARAAVAALPPSPFAR